MKLNNPRLTRTERLERAALRSAEVVIERTRVFYAARRPIPSKRYSVAGFK